MLSFIRYLLIYIFLALIQFAVLDSIRLYDYVQPAVYFYFLLVLPRMNPALFLLAGFATGLVADVFYWQFNTGGFGVHAFTNVLIAYVKFWFTRWFLTDPQTEDIEPIHIKDLGPGRFFAIVLSFSLLFHLTLNTLSFFRLSEVLNILLHSVGGAIASAAIIFITDILLFYRRQQKA